MVERGRARIEMYSCKGNCERSVLKKLKIRVEAHDREEQ